MSISYAGMVVALSAALMIGGGGETHAQLIPTQSNPKKLDQYLRGLDAMELQRYIDARKLLMPLAKDGYADPQYQIANLYIYGLEVEQDPLEALKWLKRAESNGSEDAVIALRGLYTDSSSPRPRDTAFARLFKGAAESGDIYSQFNLGQAYELGRGVKQDLKEARTWYTKAAEGGHGPAAARLVELTAMATIEESAPTESAPGESAVDGRDHDPGESEIVAGKDDAEAAPATQNGQASATAVAEAPLMGPFPPGATPKIVIDNPTILPTQTKTAKADMSDADPKAGSSLMERMSGSGARENTSTNAADAAARGAPGGQAIEPTRGIIPFGPPLPEATAMGPPAPPAPPADAAAERAAATTDEPSSGAVVIDLSALRAQNAGRADEPAKQANGSVAPTMGPPLEAAGVPSGSGTAPAIVPAERLVGETNRTSTGPADADRGSGDAPRSQVAARATPPRADAKRTARGEGVRLAPPKTPEVPRARRVTAEDVNRKMRQAAAESFRKRQYEDAVQLSKELAERGDAFGKLLLGRLYYFGLGVTADQPRGYKLMTEAEQQGLSDATTAIANIENLMADEDLAALKDAAARL